MRCGGVALYLCTGRTPVRGGEGGAGQLVRALVPACPVTLAVHKSLLRQGVRFACMCDEVGTAYRVPAQSDRVHSLEPCGAAVRNSNSNSK